jgi:hypothetical protein
LIHCISLTSFYFTTMGLDDDVDDDDDNSSIESSDESDASDEDPPQETDDATESENNDNERPQKKRRRIVAPVILKRFDVSTLLPLPHNKTNTVTQNSGNNNMTKRYTKQNDRTIELICKLTREIPVCFANCDHAAQALGVNPKVVRRACRLFAKGQDQNDIDSCWLRYTDSSTAYMYGDHSRDFHHRQEASNTRQPIKKTVAAAAAAAAAIFEGVPPAAVQPPLLGLYERQEERHQKTQKVSSFLEGATIWQESSESNSTNNGYCERLCIACQEKFADVVFEPCHHCVLCQECAQQSRCCPLWCPKCWTTIHDRLLPKTGTLCFIQPPVYSAYSFLDSK